jgi:hypothetical protein
MPPTPQTLKMAYVIVQVLLLNPGYAKNLDQGGSGGLRRYPVDRTVSSPRSVDRVGNRFQLGAIRNHIAPFPGVAPWVGRLLMRPAGPGRPARLLSVDERARRCS